MEKPEKDAAGLEKSDTAVSLSENKEQSEHEKL